MAGIKHSGRGATHVPNLSRRELRALSNDFISDHGLDMRFSLVNREQSVAIGPRKKIYCSHWSMTVHICTMLQFDWLKPETTFKSF